MQGSLANFLSPTTEVGWLVLGLRPAGVRGGRSGSKEVWEQSPKSECPSRTPMVVAEIRSKRRCVRSHEGPDRGRSPQDVLSPRRGRGSHRRAPRARQLPAEPQGLEVTRALG